MDNAETLNNVIYFSLKGYYLEQVKGGGILEKLNFGNKRVWIFHINLSIWLEDGWKHQNNGEN